MTPVFVVVLAKMLHGSTCGPTRHEVEADSADDAERIAQRADSQWKIGG